MFYLIQIEELTKLYQEKETELAQRSEQEKKLKEEIDKLSDMTEYKISYTELKRDYEMLVKKEQSTSEDYESLRKEFEQALQLSKEEEEELKAEIKHQKEQRLLADTNWESIVADRDEQLKKQSRRAQEKEIELTDKINKLQESLDNLEESVNDKGT